MSRILAVLLFSFSLSGMAPAQTAPLTPDAPDVSDRFSVLAEALQLAPSIAVMRQEGLVYGASLRDSMFPDNSAPYWDAEVSAIYEERAMSAQFLDHLRQELASEQLPALLAFLQSDLGHRVTGLELSARQAMLDDGIKTTAGQMRDALMAAGGARPDALRQFAEVNDLIEANVSGALNANLAFYNGLVDGGGVQTSLTQDQILGDVWLQEADIRTETTDWVFSYLGLAYQPLSDQDLAAYIAFSETPAARALNHAMFRAFDALFVDISYDLGRAAAKVLAGHDL